MAFLSGAWPRHRCGTAPQTPPHLPPGDTARVGTGRIPICAARLSSVSLNRILGATLVTLLASPAGAQRVESDDLFQLFNNCEAMGVEVDHVSRDLLSLGIGDSDVRETAEDRLRVARLYAPVARTRLHLAVSQHRAQVEYKKPVRDIFTGETRIVSTFKLAGTPHDETTAGVMLGLSELLDDFMVKYLRVNGSACGVKEESSPDQSTVSDAKSQKQIQGGRGSQSDYSRPIAGDSSTETQGALTFDPYVLAAMAGRTLRPDASVMRPDSDVEGSIISRARGLARNRVKDSPNFYCDMAVERLKGNVRDGQQVWQKMMPEILVRVRYVDRRDSYLTISVGGKSSDEPFDEVGTGGLRSRDEFGGMLAGIQNLEFKWFGLAVLDGRPVYIFTTKSLTDDAMIIKAHGYSGGPVATEGYIFIDRNSLETLGIVRRGVEIPDSYGFDEIMQSVFYGHVNIDGTSYLLPLASESISNLQDPLFPVYRQSSRYINYRKFHVESGVRFER